MTGIGPLRSVPRLPQSLGQGGTKSLESRPQASMMPGHFPAHWLEAVHGFTPSQGNQRSCLPCVQKEGDWEHLGTALMSLQPRSLTELTQCWAACCVFHRRHPCDPHHNPANTAPRLHPSASPRSHGSERRCPGQDQEVELGFKPRASTFGGPAKESGLPRGGIPDSALLHNPNMLPVSSETHCIFPEHGSQLHPQISREQW